MSELSESEIRSFQQARGLSVTGLVDEVTARALEEARWKLGDRSLNLQEPPLMHGDDVAADGKKVKIINESYNANPISMKNAIENFSSLAQSGKKKVAIIGDMLELGLKSKHYHEQITELLINSRIDHVHLIGKEVAYIYQKLKKFKKCNIYNNINHFGEVFSKIANDKSIFLIKGSNGIGLSKLLNDKL